MILPHPQTSVDAYKRKLNTSKNGKKREGAISDGTRTLLNEWADSAEDASAEGFVFPSEGFQLPWTTCDGDRKKIDTPKTHHSVRKAAITDDIWLELDQWRSSGRYENDQSFVFSAERGTALSKDNVWRRNMQPSLAKVGLGWANFQVMRRMHATLMRRLKADPRQSPIS